MQQYGTRLSSLETEACGKGKDVTSFLANVDYIMQERNVYH